MILMFMLVISPADGQGLLLETVHSLIGTANDPLRSPVARETSTPVDTATDEQSLCHAKQVQSVSSAVTHGTGVGP